MSFASALFNPQMAPSVLALAAGGGLLTAAFRQPHTYVRIVSGAVAIPLIVLGIGYALLVISCLGYGASCL